MPGTRIDIGGRSLHLFCSGAGSTTVVLENGLTANYSTWRLVQHGLEATTRVCSYDRAGLGHSDPSPNPTRAEFVVADLHALLDRAQVAPPYLLVGWSAGGVFVRHFFARYPAEVAGMVLVDSSHEQQAERLPSNDAVRRSEADLRDQLALCSAVAWTGAVRISGAMTRVNATLAVPTDLAGEMLAMLERTEYCAGVWHEIEGFQPDVAATVPPATLGELPLVVLTRGRAASAADLPGADEAMLEVLDRTWFEMQAELASLSTRASLIVVPEAGHAIPLEAPARVVDAVKIVMALAGMPNG